MDNQADTANGPISLKPCPLCGSEAKAELAAGYAPVVSCTSDTCTIYIMDIEGVWLNEVVEKWNTRWSDNSDDK